MKFRVEYLLLSILTLSLLIPFLAIGRQFRLDLLPDKGKNFGCGTCHIDPGGGGERNSFGKDWQAIAIPQGDKYVAAIAGKDSDGDGATNDQEFEVGTHPGDPESKPEVPRSVEPRGKRIIPWGKIKSAVRR